METKAAAIKVSLNGRSWTLAMDDITGLEAKMFRQATGVSLAGVLAGEHGGDLDVIAGVIWLARVKQGDRVAYEEVAGNLRYQDEYDLEAAPAGEAGDVGEASGGTATS